MNRSHAELTDWGLSLIQIQPDARILDVGCGGGAAVKLLAQLASEGYVTGVDFARGSVAVATQTNQELIKSGRVKIVLGDVMHLPFESADYDLITSFESHYYWPSLSQAAVELLRVMRPGGTCILVSEVSESKRYGKAVSGFMSVLGGKTFSSREYEGAFESAGFVDLQVISHEKKGWTCVRARAPAHGQ